MQKQSYQNDNWDIYFFLFEKHTVVIPVRNCISDFVLEIGWYISMISFGYFLYGVTRSDRIENYQKLFQPLLSLSLVLS